MTQFLSNSMRRAALQGSSAAVGAGVELWAICMFTAAPPGAGVI